MKCFKCGKTDGRIVIHHVSYNPEVIVDCCWSCHQTIHHRVRKNNECRYTVAETANLSRASVKKRYRQIIQFYEKMLDGIRLLEQIEYNNKNGGVYITSQFISSNNNKKIYGVNI